MAAFDTSGLLRGEFTVAALRFDLIPRIRRFLCRADILRRAWLGQSLIRSIIGGSRGRWLHSHCYTAHGTTSQRLLFKRSLHTRAKVCCDKQRSEIGRSDHHRDGTCGDHGVKEPPKVHGTGESAVIRFVVHTSKTVAGARSTPTLLEAKIAAQFTQLRLSDGVEL